MAVIDFPIETINRFLDNHIIESNFPLGYGEDFIVPVNIKIKLTGVKNYISVGESKPFVQYTMTILPTGNPTDVFLYQYGLSTGVNVLVSTTSNEYDRLRMSTNSNVNRLLEYFGVDKPSICTRVINKVTKSNPVIEESKSKKLINEDKYDSVVRQIVRDIIHLFKTNKDGEYGLPEDLYPEKHVYEFSQLETELQIFVEIKSDETVDGFEVDASFFREDEMIYVTIVANPKFSQIIIQPLIGELNELIRHEIEHVKQYEQGLKFPKKEPKNSEKYYSQKHEIDAQRAGFKRRSKKEKIDYETIVRNWFDDNKHKHKLSPEQAERVIQKISRDK